MNKHDKQKGRVYRTVPLCSQGEVALQHGVENGVASVDLLLFCSFSSSASSLRGRQRTVLEKKLSDINLMMTWMVPTFWLLGTVYCWACVQHPADPPRSILGPAWSEAPGSDAPCWPLLLLLHLEPAGVLSAQTEALHALPHSRQQKERKHPMNWWREPNFFYIF